MFILSPIKQFLNKYYNSVGIKWDLKKKKPWISSDIYFDSSVASLLHFVFKRQNLVRLLQWGAHSPNTVELAALMDNAC